jgi:hypothetical protein
MHVPPLPRRALVSLVASLSLVGGGLAVAFAADPTAGCSFTDPAGDTALPNSVGDPDEDLDIVTAGLTKNDTALLLSIKVTALAAGPDAFAGDDFFLDFTLNKKAFDIGSTRDVVDAGTPYVNVDGTDQTDAAPSLKSTYDEKTSVIEISISTADLAKLAGAPVDGAVLSSLSAASAAVLVAAGGPEQDADDAKPKDPVVWVFGASSCSGATASGSPSPGASASPGASPPPSDTGTATIAVSAPARIQTSDPEPVTATLKDSSGQPMAGKRVTAQVGAGKAVAGTTNSAGQVRLNPVVIDKAGTRALVVRYAGDSSGAGKAETRKSLTVVGEVSKLATRSSGSGSSRTFTITLTDDDAVRHPYASARLSVSYSGRTVAVTTNSAGQASLKIRSGTHVDIRYAGRTGYVQATSARTVA